MCIYAAKPFGSDLLCRPQPKTASSASTRGLGTSSSSYAVQAQKSEQAVRRQLPPPALAPKPPIQSALSPPPQEKPTFISYEPSAPPTFISSLSFPSASAVDSHAASTYTQLQSRMERMESMLNQLSRSGIVIPDIDSFTGSIPASAQQSQSQDKLDQVHRDLLRLHQDPRHETSTPPVPLSAMDMHILQPEMSIKTNRLTYFGPLSGVAAIREDEFIKAFLDKVDKAKKLIYSRNQSDPTCNNVGKTTSFSAPKKGRTSHDTSIPKLSYIPAALKKHVDEIFDVQADPINLFPRLELRPICEFFIDRFMQSANIMFPVVNPAVFRSDMAKYWKAKELAVQESSKSGGNRDSKPFWMSTRKNDMRGAALFAMMLRLGRLSLAPDWKPSSAGFDDSYSVLFGPRLLSFVWSCLRETNYMGKPNLVVAQTLICIRLHQMVAPEDGDGSDGSDAAGFLGMLCQVGMSMGLHRDPSLFPSMPPNLADLWRMLWSQMVILDTYRSHDLALPFSIPLEMCDTSLNRIRGFPDSVTQLEQLSLPFIQTHIEWALLARSILNRLMTPDLVLTYEEFETMMTRMDAFEETHLSSFQSLISIMQGDASMSGPQDSYNLMQKYLILLLFLRLQLSLLRSFAPKDIESAEKFRRARLRCALKMLDTMATCLHHERLFNGFEWLLVPFSLRNFFYPIALVMNGILKAYYADPEGTTIPPALSSSAADQDSQDERWLVPDMAFQYDDRSVCGLHRLYQAFVKTHVWIKRFSVAYYGAYKPGLVVGVLIEYVRHEVVGGVERREQKLKRAVSEQQALMQSQPLQFSMYTKPSSQPYPFNGSSLSYPHQPQSDVVAVDEALMFGDKLGASIAMLETNDYMGGAALQGWGYVSNGSHDAGTGARQSGIGDMEEHAGLDVDSDRFMYSGFGTAHAYV